MKDTWGNRDPFAPAVESLKLENLMGQFYNGIAPLFWLDTSMSRASVCSKRITGIPFTRTDNIPIVTCRL